MNDPRKPDKFSAGARTIKAAALNAIADAVPGAIIAGTGIRIVRNAGNRYVISLAEQQGRTAPPYALAVVVDIRDKYLVCDKDDAPIAVAKPWALRRGVVWPSGAEYSYASAGARTATGAFGTEEQVITPDYEVGEELLVARLASTRINDDDGAPIVWYDTNSAGRCWAVLP